MFEGPAGGYYGRRVVFYFYMSRSKQPLYLQVFEIISPQTFSSTRYARFFQPVSDIHMGHTAYNQYRYDWTQASRSVRIQVIPYRNAFHARKASYVELDIKVEYQTRYPLARISIFEHTHSSTLLLKTLLWVRFKSLSRVPSYFWGLIQRPRL